LGLDELAATYRASCASDQNIDWATRFPSTIVGVVEVVKQRGAASAAGMTAYYAMTQQGGGALFGASMYLVACTSSDPASVANAIEHAVHAIDPYVAVYDTATMAARLQRSLARQRFSTAVLGGFAMVALVLAAVGVFGVMSYLVSHGRREIAVRMALGARRTDVLALVLTQGMLLSSAGVAVGLVGSAVLSRVVRDLLYGARDRSVDVRRGVAGAVGDYVRSMLCADATRDGRRSGRRPAWRIGRVQAGSRRLNARWETRKRTRPVSSMGRHGQRRYGRSPLTMETQNALGTGARSTGDTVAETVLWRQTFSANRSCRDSGATSRVSNATVRDDRRDPLALARRSSICFDGAAQFWNLHRPKKSRADKPDGPADSGVVLPACTAAVALGVLSSALLFTLEMNALRALPGRTFSILMSLEPAVARLCGLFLLGEHLTKAQWAAVVW
jgi:hypothetical protein